jgi:hypothetical protein
MSCVIQQTVSARAFSLCIGTWPQVGARVELHIRLLCLEPRRSMGRLIIVIGGVTMEAAMESANSRKCAAHANWNASSRGAWDT